MNTTDTAAITSRIEQLSIRYREMTIRLSDWLRNAEGDLPYVIWPKWAMRLQHEESEIEEELESLKANLEKAVQRKNEIQHQAARAAELEADRAAKAAWAEKIAAITDRNNQPDALRARLANLRRNHDLLRPDCRQKIRAEIQSVESKLAKLSAATK